MARLTKYEVAQIIEAAGETIAAGLCVYETGGASVVCSDGANQAATQQLALRGICIAEAATGTVPQVAELGSPVAVIAGTGGLAAGEEWMAEHNTGRVVGVASGTLTLVADDYIGGRVIKGASAGDWAIVEVNIRRQYVDV